MDPARCSRPSAPLASSPSPKDLGSGIKALGLEGALAGGEREGRWGWWPCRGAGQGRVPAMGHPESQRFAGIKGGTKGTKPVPRWCFASRPAPDQKAGAGRRTGPTRDTPPHHHSQRSFWGGGGLGVWGDPWQVLAAGRGARGAPPRRCPLWGRGGPRLAPPQSRGAAVAPVPVPPPRAPGTGAARPGSARPGGARPPGSHWRGAARGGGDGGAAIKHHMAARKKKGQRLIECLSGKRCGGGRRAPRD